MIEIREFDYYLHLLIYSFIIMNFLPQNLNIKENMKNGLYYKILIFEFLAKTILGISLSSI